MLKRDPVRTPLAQQVKPQSEFASPSVKIPRVVKNEMSKMLMPKTKAELASAAPGDVEPGEASDASCSSDELGRPT